MSGGGIIIDTETGSDGRLRDEVPLNERFSITLEQLPDLLHEIYEIAPEAEVVGLFDDKQDHARLSILKLHIAAEEAAEAQMLQTGEDASLAISNHHFILPVPGRKYIEQWKGYETVLRQRFGNNIHLVEIHPTQVSDYTQFISQAENPVTGIYDVSIDDAAYAGFMESNQDDLAGLEGLEQIRLFREMTSTREDATTIALTEHYNNGSLVKLANTAKRFHLIPKTTGEKTLLKVLMDKQSS